MYSLIPEKKIKATALPTGQAKSDPNRAINIGCSTLLAATFLVVVALAASGYALPWNGAVDAAGGMSDTYVCLTAQDFVERQLKAPSTAAFAPCGEPDTMVSHSGSTWSVTSWVDADNSFGATLRNNFTVQLSYSAASDTWTLVKTTMTGR